LVGLTAEEVVFDDRRPGHMTGAGKWPSFCPWAGHCLPDQMSNPATIPLGPSRGNLQHRCKPSCAPYWYVQATPERSRSCRSSGCFRNLLLAISLYLHLSKSFMFYFTQAKAAEARFGCKCGFI